MPVSVYLSRETIIVRTHCPTCGADKGDACMSRFLGRPMVNEVHRARRTTAVGIRA